MHALHIALVAAFLAGPIQGTAGKAAPGSPTPAAGSTSAGLGAADWAGIRAAWTAGQHAIHPDEGGHRARNAGQRWTTFFDGRGFCTTPDAGGWRWGLDLVRYGWAEHEHVVTLPQAVSGVGGRVAYTWDDRLTEWYVNDPRGLEHGYTVHARPPQANGPLTLDLAVRGGLSPAVSTDGRDVRFVAGGASAVLTYAGLSVFGADGQAVMARGGIVAGCLQLQVEDQDACYPLTIDPIAQQAYFKASNTEAVDHFGASIAMWGDTLVVGAPYESSSATGVNGDQSDNSAKQAGAAYVFVRNGTTWSQQAYLKASNPDAYDHFGNAVSISADTIVIGAPWEASGATGVNGDGSDNTLTSSGASYVFVRSGTTWSQQAYLKASNTSPFDFFGGAVAIAGDTLIVGASAEDDSATDSGAAYVFVRNGTHWSQQALLKASNPGGEDYFGSALAVSGETIVAGAAGEDSSATGVNGDQHNNGAFSAGAAYVFVRSGTAWTQQAYLKASNTEAYDGFAWSLGLSGDTLVVGAPWEDSGSVGVNGDGSSNAAFQSGAAYVFVRDGSTWSQHAYLKASNADADENFGRAVAISQDTILVGSPFEDGGSVGVNGNQGSNGVIDSGAAYGFVRSGGAWTQQAYLKASNTGAGDRFGWSVTLHGDILAVGAWIEDGGSTGVNGDGSDNSAGYAGAVYAFTMPCGSIAPFGVGCPGSGGFTPSLDVTGCATGNGTLQVEIAGGLGGSSALLLIGTTAAALPVGGACTLLVGPAVLVSVPGLLGGSGAGNGSSSFTAALPPSTQAVTIVLQAAVADTANPIGLTLSNGVQIGMEQT